jgi:antirestriction protein ArdC
MNNVYEIITQRILEKMKEGYIPWKKPWIGSAGSYNIVSKKPYSLTNQILLDHRGAYATFKQWQNLGGKVKKGAKSEVVIFWKMQEIEEKDEDSGEIRKKNVPLLRYYRVIHVSDVEGVAYPDPEEKFNTEPIQEAEDLLHSYLDREKISLHILQDGNSAYYRPSDDSITLPEISQFKLAEEYYGTIFHECSHSTMKKSRCDREEENKRSHFGNAVYSREELVAEISSAAILNNLKIETPETFTNSAAYIQGWSRALKKDPKLFVTASARAEKAANYILGVS